METNNQRRCDVVMPILMRDWPAAQINLPYVFRNLPVKLVVVVSSRQLEPLLPRDPRLAFVCEDELLPGLTLQAVKDVMYRRVYSTHRSGWLFQQFLKLGYARLCGDEAYITWDADTIPVRPIAFENEEGQLLFTLKEEYNAPYFETMENLLGLKKAVKESFIAENMIFDTALVNRMLEEIEANTRLPGESFWEKILWAIPEESLQKSGFSEFETFGTYAVTRAPERYALRHLATLRSGKNILGASPTPAMLDWAAESYDTVSMEKFSESTPLRFLAASRRYRQNHTAAQLEAYKNRFHVIPAVYRWASHLWPNFKIWGGKYKRRLRARLKQKRNLDKGEL